MKSVDVAMDTFRLSARVRWVSAVPSAPRVTRVTMATRASWRRDVGGIVEWRVNELERLGVEVQYNTLAEAEEILAENPDIVIMAKTLIKRENAY